MMISSTIAQILLDTGAMKISINPPFKLTSGLLGPAYCDTRILISFPQERSIIINGYIDLIKQKGIVPDAIGGTATAGIPWAAFVAQKMNLPMFYVRPKPKEHGTGKQVEGSIKKGLKVVMIEDVFMTGGSAIKAAQAVTKELEAQVLGILAIATHELDLGRKAFSDAGLETGSLTTIDSVLELLRTKGSISDKEIEKIKSYRQDPENWGEKMGRKS